MISFPSSAFTSLLYYIACTSFSVWQKKVSANTSGEQNWCKYGPVGDQIKDSSVTRKGANKSHVVWGYKRGPGGLGRQNCRSEWASRCLSCSSISSPPLWQCQHLVHPYHLWTAEKVWEAVLARPTPWDARCLRSALVRVTPALSSVHMSNTLTVEPYCPTVLDPSMQWAVRGPWPVLW